MSKDGLLLAAVLEKNNTIHIFNMNNLRTAHVFKDTTSAKNILIFSPNGQWLAAASEKSYSIYIWNLGTHKLHKKLKHTNESQTSTIRTIGIEALFNLTGACKLKKILFIPNSQRLASFCEQKEIGADGNDIKI